MLNLPFTKYQFSTFEIILYNNQRGILFNTEKKVIIAISSTKRSPIQALFIYL